MQCIRPTLASSSWPSLPLYKWGNRTPRMQGHGWNSPGLALPHPAPNLFSLCRPVLTGLFSSLGSWWRLRFALLSRTPSPLGVSAWPSFMLHPADLLLLPALCYGALGQLGCRPIHTNSLSSMQTARSSFLACSRFAKSKNHVQSEEPERWLGPRTRLTCFMLKYELPVDIFPVTPATVWIRDSLCIALSLFRRVTVL